MAAVGGESIVPKEDVKECSICKNNIGINNIAKTECNHEFHVDCLVKWLIEHKTCPLCRDEIKHENNQPILDNKEQEVIIRSIKKIIEYFKTKESGRKADMVFYRLSSRFTNLSRVDLYPFQWLLDNLDYVGDWYHFKLTLRMFENQYPDYFIYPPIYEVLKRDISVDNMKQLKIWPGFYNQLLQEGVQEKCDEALADRPILREKFNKVNCIIM